MSDEMISQLDARLARSYIVSLSTVICDVLQRQLVDADDMSEVFKLAWKMFVDIVESGDFDDAPAYIEIWSLYDQQCVCHITVSEYYRTGLR